MFIAVSYNGGQVLEEHVAIAATAIMMIIIISKADLYMFTVNCKDYHAFHMAV